jgi:Na+/melibiose symporter-like transporter
VRRFTVRWPFRIGAAVIGVIVLVVLWTPLWRVAKTGDVKGLLLLGISIGVFAGSYLWIALGGTNRFDRWITARRAARNANAAREANDDELPQSRRRLSRLTADASPAPRPSNTEP